MRLLAVLIAVCAVSACVTQPRIATGAGDNDCRVAPDPLICTVAQRERIEEAEAREIRWQRERRRIDRPDNPMYPSRRNDFAGAL